MRRPATSEIALPRVPAGHEPRPASDDGKRVSGRFTHPRPPTRNPRAGRYGECPRAIVAFSPRIILPPGRVTIQTNHGGLCAAWCTRSSSVTGGIGKDSCEGEGVGDSNAVALSWRKSSASASGDCVEVAAQDGHVLLRDSKGRQSHILKFTVPEWDVFLSETQSGMFDLDVLKTRCTIR